MDEVYSLRSSVSVLQMQIQQSWVSDPPDSWWTNFSTYIMAIIKKFLLTNGAHPDFLRITLLIIWSLHFGPSQGWARHLFEASNCSTYAFFSILIGWYNVSLLGTCLYSDKRMVTFEPTRGVYHLLLTNHRRETIFLYINVHVLFW